MEGGGGGRDKYLLVGCGGRDEYQLMYMGKAIPILLLPPFVPLSIPPQSLPSVLKSKPGIPGARITVWRDSRQSLLVPSFS